MIEKTVTPEVFDGIVKGKTDKSWDRYNAGRADLVDRYDITAALVKGTEVLDIGCAESLLAGLVYARRVDVQRVCGIDANPAMVKESIHRLGDKADVMTGYAEDLPYTSGRFDTVVLGQTLEHVFNAQDSANEALRVLMVGGRLIVNVPANDTEPHGNHLRVFQTIDDLKGLFGSKIRWEGWGVIHTFYYAWGERV